MHLPCPLILASASPARAQLLHEAGLEFTQEASGIHEPARLDDEPLSDYVLRLATYKSEAMHERHPDACILTCDTVIELDHHPLGKPQHAREAFEMIRLMEGRAHHVHTGIVLCAPGAPRQTWSAAAETQVYFKPLSDEAIHAYVKKSQPYIFAGAYAIQGDGADLVERIDGRMDTVIGLPIDKVLEGLQALFPSP